MSVDGPQFSSPGAGRLEMHLRPVENLVGIEPVNPSPVEKIGNDFYEGTLGCGRANRRCSEPFPTSG